jgi:VWFA-related protein
MQRAADGFIKGLRPQDRAGIANFDTSVRMQTRWSDSRQQIATAVAGLTEGKRPGGTAFYRAVQVSLAAELLPIAGRRRALIVLTDGRDNGLYLPLLRQGELPRPQQESAFQQMIDLARRERVPIYIVTVSNSANEVATLRNRFSAAVASQYLDAVAVRMEQLAEVTGGRILFPKRLDDIVPLYNQISRELGSAYSIGFVSNLPLSVRGFRDIEVRTTDDRLHVVQSRSGYVVQ